MWQLVRMIKLMLLALCVAHANLYAGSQQLGQGDQYPIEAVIPFAKKVEQYAATRGARVFIIARLGSPQALLPKGIAFTHVGLAVYSTIQTSKGEIVKGYAIHNLYQQNDRLDRSHLVTDYPVDFFSGVAELKAGIIIPSPKLQDKLLHSLALGQGEQLHNPHYSLAANPYSSTYQNCTEHTLNILFAAIYGTDSLAQIKANQRAYFTAHEIKVSPLKRFLAPMVSRALPLSDQRGQVKVATFTSIAKFLQHYGLASGHVVIEEDGVSEYVAQR